jgi:hypothetical protein
MNKKLNYKLLLPFGGIISAAKGCGKSIRRFGIEFGSMFGNSILLGLKFFRDSDMINKKLLIITNNSLAQKHILSIKLNMPYNNLKNTSFYFAIAPKNSNLFTYSVKEAHLGLIYYELGLVYCKSFLIKLRRSEKIGQFLTFSVLEFQLLLCLILNFQPSVCYSIPTVFLDEAYL